MPIGFTLPFAKSTGTLGYFATSNNELQATYYNLKSLLLTNWGERPNHFNLGCNLSEFLFAPNNEETQADISQRISTQVSQWLPYVNIDELQINQSEHRISIHLKFSIRGRQDLSNVVDVVIGG